MSERTAVKRFTIRTLKPEEILSEEEASRRLHPKFPEPWETALTELSRTYELARARLRLVFKGELLNQSLLVQTPMGLAVVWRIWGETLQVVRAVLQNDHIVLEPGVVSIPPSLTSGCQFIVDRILGELPPWSH